MLLIECPRLVVPSYKIFKEGPIFGMPTSFSVPDIYVRVVTMSQILLLGEKKKRSELVTVVFGSNDTLVMIGNNIPIDIPYDYPKKLLFIYLFFILKFSNKKEN